MLGILLAGASLGLAAGFSPGPLFAMVISQTVKYGRGEGIKVALSPLVTDLPVIAVSLFLVAGVSASKPLLGLISLAGGVFLFYLAYENLTARNIAVTATETAPRSLVKGAMVNALSPHPYLFWITVGGPLILGAYSESLARAAGFVASFYACLIGAKVVLAVVASGTRGFLQGRAYVYLLRALGVLLLFFAGVLLLDGWRLLAG